MVMKSSFFSFRFKVQAVTPFLIRFMSITRSLLWFGEQVIPAEARVPKTKLLDASEDAHGRVIIDMKEPMDSDLFASVLRTSISHWRQQVFFF